MTLIRGLENYYLVVIGPLFALELSQSNVQYLISWFPFSSIEIPLVWEFDIFLPVWFLLVFLPMPQPDLTLVSP